MEKQNPRGGRRPNAGRKPIDDSQKRRTRSILLTDAEYLELTRIAQKMNITRSALVAKWIDESNVNNKP